MEEIFAVNFSNEGVQQRPMLTGFERVTVNTEQGENVIGRFSDKELKEPDLDSRSFEDVSNQNADKLKQHDATLKRWNDNVETAQAMCAEKLDQGGNTALNRAIKSDGTITFNSDKNIFFYNNNGKTAKFKVIQGSNGKHLLQITIVGRLSKNELESRIEEIVNALRACCNAQVQEHDDGKRTLNLDGTEIVLPSNMNGNQRASFKVEHNKIHFQGDSYKNDMEGIFGQDNIPVNVNEGFPAKEMSNEVWRNQCMRKVNSMMSPMVELNEEYGKFLDNKNIKAPVNCLFELLSMNMMLNSVLGSQNKQHEEILKIAGALSLAIEQGAGAVSIGGAAATEITEDSFESWKTTLENIHVAYLHFTERIADHKNSATFLAEEAVLRQHEALLRELFIEATNRASDVLEVDISLAKGNIESLSKKEIADMEFSSASGIMSNVIKMFIQKYDDKQQALKLEKEKEEKSQREIAGLRENVRRLTASVEERNGNIEKLEESIKEHKAQNQALMQQNEELMQQIKAEKEASNQQIEDLKDQIGELKDVVEEQNREISDLKDTIQQQSDKIDELNQTIVQNAEESKKKISDLEEEIQQLDETLNERNERIKELIENIKTLETQIKELQEKSVQPMAGSNSSAIMFNPINSMSGVGHYGMQQVDNDMKKKVEELEKLCNDQKKEIKQLKNELERMQVDHDELDRLRAERDEWKHKYEEQSRELSEIADKGSVTTQQLEQKVKESQNRLNQFEPEHREVDESYLSKPKPLSFIKK